MQGCTNEDLAGLGIEQKSSDTLRKCWLFLKSVFESKFLVKCTYKYLYSERERKRWKARSFTKQKLHNFKQIKSFNKNQNTDATLKRHKIRAALCFSGRGKVGK